MQLQHDFFWVFIISPAEECCLAQLLVIGQFCILNFADELGTNPLDFLFDARRINEGRFVDVEGLHSLNSVLQSLFAEAGSSVTIMPEFPAGVRAEHHRAQMLSASFGSVNPTTMNSVGGEL
jgi:hypothetical protein